MRLDRWLKTRNAGQTSGWPPPTLLCAFSLALSLSAAARPAPQQQRPDPPSDPPAASSAAPTPAFAPQPLLDQGFRDLYDLNFPGARQEFAEYQTQQPNDPLGKAAEAASYLYEEFDRKGVFTSRFFLDDRRLLGGVAGDPARNRNDRFLGADLAARRMAQARVKADPRDQRGLMVLAIADGMESDYAALIEKDQMTSLDFMKRAEENARRLLAVDPSAADAYVALGASHYILGCMPLYKRAFLWFDGLHGDRARGMAELESAAEHGRYLRPFAKIMLALAAEREHQTALARKLLSQLRQEFPHNPVFARELALLNHESAGNLCDSC